ncbi:hypothetical protein AB0950_09355 [Streptomyces sp. NPDC007189]|uniref:hypothetical protein n=1 Tax=Streptomyces sp. NPDC007189 TaxID=3154315 RepID=UPI003451BF3C
MSGIRHGNGLRQRTRGERLDHFRTQEGGGPEGRRLNTGGEKTLQRCDLCVQFLGPALRLRLPVLAVALGDSPLVGACLLLFLPPSSGIGLCLPLLLPLHLGPDAYHAIGTTTHVVQALPKRTGCPHNQV